MLLAVAVVLATLNLAPQPALARVHFDPESPAGKEYALPLDQARDEAAGPGRSDGPAGRKARLFGEGISKQGAAPTASGGGSGAAGRGSDGGHSGGEEADGAQGGHPRELSASVIAAASNSDRHYSLSNAILWVVAIVGLGGVLAFGIRAARRPHSS